MSKLTDLLRQVERKDPQLAADLEREYKALSSRRSFGLNFERHHPESTEISGRQVRRGEKVRILPPRGCLDAGDNTLWTVQRIERVDGGRAAHLIEHDADKSEIRVVNVDDLMVVSIFRDFIYPGLASTGKVQRGDDKPFHTVVNGENYHALKTLTYTHKGKIDAIYIDPPYNTGAKDWKYNNDYVEGDDLYRHSKWLAFIERRLLVAKDLLNPNDSVLIVTVDEKEYLRLGLLLEQTFPEARIQMVSSIINPKGATRSMAFGRTDEYLYFVMFGNSGPRAQALGSEWKVVRDSRAERLRWAELLRSGTHARRIDRPSQFYPIFLRNTADGPVFDSAGDAYVGTDREAVKTPAGCVAVWPIRSDGTEGRWQIGAPALKELFEAGYAKLGSWREDRTTVSYLKRGEQGKVEQGLFPILGKKTDGSIIVDEGGYVPVFVPGTQWRIASHEAGGPGGSGLLRVMMPDRRFPYPKSLYAVEDALRFFVKEKPDAVILDFFSGSGTTAHAVMRLNKQDDGRRQCISVTNNEVGADEQKALRKAGLRPGDPEWEQRGICDYITKPRLEAAITGRTPDGDLVKGDYKFVDEFPISEGFKENVEFFELTYETRTEVAHHKAFGRIAPLLWLRAGARGACIETEPEDGWALAEAYGVLVDLDASTAFVEAVEAASGIGMIYIVTDDERRFQAGLPRLPLTLGVDRFQATLRP